MLYAGFYNLKQADKAARSAQTSRRASEESNSSEASSSAQHKLKKFLKRALEELKPLPVDQRQTPVGFYQPLIERGPLFHRRKASETN